MKNLPCFSVLRAFFLLTALLLASPGVGRAEAFARGLVSWDEGDPAAAARSFQLAIDQSGPSAAAFFNLGLAREQTGDSVGALVAFLRARALDPGSAQIQAALGRVLTAQGWNLPVAPNYVEVARQWGLPLLYVGGAVAAWLGLLALVVGLLRRPGRFWWVGTGVLVGTLGAGVLGWAAISDPLLGEKNWAVVEAEATPVTLRVSPMETAGMVEKVPAGAVVEEISRRAGWSFCRLPSGKEGWLPARHLQRVLPETPSISAPTGSEA